MRAPARLLLVVAVCAAGARDARGWDSICHEFADATKPVEQLGAASGRGCEGMIAAHGRWRDPTDMLDEHRALMQHAIEQAGLPADLLQTIVLAVPTLGNNVDVGGGRRMPTLSPVPLDYGMAIARLEKRGFALDELAQLPDFSYSLADWANGNERCPVPEIANAPVLGTAVECHRFKTHMGALNASHFPPQSDRWYRWTHDLARMRADQCKAMRAGAWASFGDPGAAAAFDARWQPIWRECEVEALALEAVAQHYLQDSWSSGHMWQRWGSGKLGQLPATEARDAGSAWMAFPPDGRRLMTGELVGIYSGTIHGSDVPQYELLRSWTTFVKVDADLACYPRDNRIGYLAGAATVPAAGDMHVHDVVGDPLAAHLFGRTAAALHSLYQAPLLLAGHTSSAELAPQLAAITGCASASVREVYDRLADPATFGVATFGPASGAAPPPPGPECDGPRLSPYALARSIDDLITAETKYKLAVWNDAVLAPVPDDIDGQAFSDYDEARKVAWLLAKHHAPTPEAADLSWAAFDHEDLVCVAQAPGQECRRELRSHHEPGGTLRMLGVERNSFYATPPGMQPATYADPPLPWGDPAMPQLLADNTDEQRLASTFHRAHAPLWCARTDRAELTAFEDRAKNAPLASKADACRLCTEVVSRHVRPGAGGKSLCDVLKPGSVAFDGDGDATRVAERRCGCSDMFAAVADSGMSFVRVDPAGAPTTVSGPYPAGALARDATSATRNRIFITNGQGDVVGFRWVGMVNPGASELELSPGDPTTPRLHLGGDPRGVAFVQSLGKDWLLVADNASDLLRVYDLGDENLEKFELCSTIDVGRDPTRVEGAWDVVIKPDGSKAFVSLRGPVSNPGDAIAMVDLLGLFSCDGQNPPVTHVTTFGGGQGIGAMAFSPDGQHLAVAARTRNTCLDQIWDKLGFVYVQQDTQVGCDMVYVLRVNQLAAGPVASNAMVTFGNRTSLPTRPVSYPYAVAWRPDGAEVAYGSFLGLSPWPLYANMNAQGAVALGTITAPAFPSTSGLLHWSYKAPLAGPLAGETVEFTGDGQYVIAAALDGTIYSLPATPGHHFWQMREADPETTLHAVNNGFQSWYGGCRVMGSCPGGFCPQSCPTGATDAVQTLSLGSPVRKLLKL